MNRNSLVVAGALVLVAVALVYHASAMRYEVTQLNPVTFVRTDRLTGRSELCIEHRMDATLTCQVVVAGTDSLR